MIKVNTKYLPQDFKFLISGGVDSIAAAHFLRVVFRRDFQLIHFNHVVYPINTKMENTVKRFAEEFEFPYTRRSRVYSPKFTDTSENGLRQWRLFEMCQMGGNFITAHHLNDAVENYLMNVFRGHPEHTPIKWESQQAWGGIYHPFLKTTKQSFIDYVKENDLEEFVVEDPTNNGTKEQRNWIRNSIIPLIEKRENVNLETVVRKKFYN